jgi:hypothetical protein
LSLIPGIYVRLPIYVPLGTADDRDAGASGISDLLPPTRGGVREVTPPSRRRVHG